MPIIFSCWDPVYRELNENIGISSEAGYKLEPSHSCRATVSDLVVKMRVREGWFCFPPSIGSCFASTKDGLGRFPPYVRLVARLEVWRFAFFKFGSSTYVLLLNGAWCPISIRRHYEASSSRLPETVGHIQIAKLIY